MKLLYFAPHQIYPVNSGGRLRDFQLARQLAARASVTFVEMSPEGEKQHRPAGDFLFAGIVTLNKERTYTPGKILRGLAGPLPLTLLNCWSPRSASRLRDLMRSEQFDAVQMEGVHLVEYLPIFQQAPGKPEIVIDWHNIESEAMWRYAGTTTNPAKRIVAKRTAKLIEFAEDRLLDAGVTHTVTSEREKKKLLARCRGANIHVIPNGIETALFDARKITDAIEQPSENNSKRNILFVGSMDYHANIDAMIWFSRTAWQEIARNHPDLHLTIVGREPAPQIRALASDRIHVTGTVDEIRPYYASALAAVVPIRSGSGTRLKILEAMAAGVPVVSTRLGAEGLEVKDNVHLLLADSGPEIAAAIERISHSTETRIRLSQAGRALVCGAYDWSAIGEQLYGIHAGLAESNAVGTVQGVC